MRPIGAECDIVAGDVIVTSGMGHLSQGHIVADVISVEQDKYEVSKTAVASRAWISSVLRKCWCSSIPLGGGAMKHVRVIVTLFVAVLLQAAVIPALLPGVVVPDLVFCLSAAVAIAAGGGPE